MGAQSWCQGFIYVDAFAGPGIHQVRGTEQVSFSEQQMLFNEAASYSRDTEEQKTFLAGSPRVALELDVPFSHYVFVEKREDRIASLEALKSEFSSTRSIAIRKGDCNTYLREKLVENPRIDWNKYRALVFLDPFGMQVPWSTLEGLAQTKAVEVFLNFPVGMAIQRLLVRDPNSIKPTQRKRLDDYFGSQDWYNVIYAKGQRGLFGDTPDEKVQKSGEALVRWYQKRLGGAFGHVSKASLIRNTKKGHLYYLMLATPNATGRRIADYILKAGEFI